MPRANHTIFWLLVVAIGGTLLWRIMGNVVPSWVVVLLALILGAFGLVVFTRNMRDAKAAWSELSSAPKPKSGPDTPGTSPRDDSPH